jgi:hypothetical protein
VFDYPLPIPRRNTHYEVLDVGPEATAHEIGQAGQVLKRSFKQQGTAAQRRLEAVYAEVSGLREAHDTVARLIAEGDRADHRDESRAATRELARLEKRALAIEPEYRALRERVTEMNRRIEEINAMKLQDPKVRRDYDRDHAPLELLKLADPARRDFAADARTTMLLLRRELSRFLEEGGHEVYHPSDLTRDNFERDFIPTPLLDGPTG